MIQSCYNPTQRHTENREKHWGVTKSWSTTQQAADGKQKIAAHKLQKWCKFTYPQNYFTVINSSLSFENLFDCHRLLCSSVDFSLLFRAASQEVQQVKRHLFFYLGISEEIVNNSKSQLAALPVFVMWCDFKHITSDN